MVLVATIAVVPNGPHLFTDKSTLQSLSSEEALWLNLYFRLNLTPILVLEILADLAHERFKSPNSMVRSLARKTTIFPGWLTAHHDAVVRSEIQGNTAELDGRPVVLERDALTSGNGKGILLRRPTEMEAMDRWCKEAFYEVERRWARSWREQLAALDLRALAREVTPVPRTLEECHDLAVRLVDRDGERYTTVRRAISRFAPGHREDFIPRWKRAGGPRLRDFAPFCAHVLTVDTFFGVALGARLISQDRPSNRIDMAYCYYLPFCQIFVSNDDLHTRVVPLFLKADQVFIDGRELKTDLARLNSLYETQPEAVQREGAFRFAAYPPTTGDFLTARIWDGCIPNWRAQAEAPPVALSRPQQEALSALADRHKTPDTAQARLSLDAADVLMVQHEVRVQVGRWSLFSPEVEEREPQV
jgi:hypothetical protein